MSDDCDHIEVDKVGVYKAGYLTWRTYRCVCGELFRTVEVPINEAAAEWVQ